MAFRSVTSALVVASASAELHCVGRVAHEVLASPEVGDFSVWPTPERNSECLIQAGGDGSKTFCLGVNQNADCTGPSNPDFDLGVQVHCRGCFVAARTDLVYTLHTSRWIPQNLSFGLQNTKVLSNLKVSHTGNLTRASGQGSKHFLSQPIVHHITVPFSMDISLELPTEIFYSGLADVGADGEVGASFSIDVPDTLMQWVSGEGWSRNMNKPQVSYKPVYSPEDITADANISLGLKTDLKAKFGENAWYTSKISAAVPMTNDASVDVKEHDAKDCLNIGIDVDVAQEAEASFRLFGHNITGKHFGPFVSGIHQEHAVHKCVEKRQPSVLVV